MVPTILEAAGVPAPVSVDGVPQQPVEGTSMRYSFDDAGAAERRTTQYFEMVGNRGIYHEGWTAVTRHGVPWLMVDAPRSFDDDVWELYDTSTDWTQAHDVAAHHPELLASLRALFDEEAEKHQVLPLDDRVTERENPELAGRLDLHAGRTSLSFGPRTGRLTEEAAPNVKNRTHTVGVQASVDGLAGGVLVAQGGRFGGWSFYCHEGRLCYAYNCYGRTLTTVRGDARLEPGEHELVAHVEYDGGPPGDGATVTLLVDGAEVARGHVPQTTAYYFSFDETFNVGVDRGTPVTDDYPPVRNAFTGTVHGVRVDLAPQVPLDEAGRSRVAAATAD